MITVAFLILAGCGGVLRAIAGHRLNQHNGFAFGTFCVNVAGSFLLGLIHKQAPNVVTVFGTGFLGALTTYSSFTRDAIALVELRRFALSVTYMTATLALCLLAAALGMHLAP